jgi:hypothetical protein
MDHRYHMFPPPQPYYHSARRSSRYRSLRIEPTDSPGVATTGRLLKGTGWQVVWVAQPTDETIRTVETTRCVVLVGHIVGD